MRLAFVSATTIHHADSDGAARLNRLATALSERGHEVTVITAKWWQGDFVEFEQDGLTYHAVGDGSTGGLSTPLGVVNAIREVDPDVVHAACELPNWIVAARIGATLSGAGLLVECYDPPETTGGFGGWLRSAGLRAADAIVTPSTTVETTVRALGVDAADIQVIPTGIDMDLVRETAPTESGDIVYSRRLDDGANLETLLLALAEFREYDWTATIIGDGPRRAAYERQARDLRIDDRVTFVGDLPVAERIARFKAAHVYVHTAEYTPFAHDLLRALAAGCVSVVEYHEAASAHELVEHEERGFTATSPEELTRRLAAAGDLERRTFDEAFARFDDDAVLETYLDRYRSIRS
ncbi:glycosyltransferase [Halodesulfurarchaeum sp. HSR-GB]|uniref:glycosyltransferase n=1 Tax=Halodesulfurarchaeum sp. HSR-GB TaxID=3074077 RepID=UPI00285D1E0F|nr:glycosyltransferase [Halodesulfurarchaeum sp. HSR-GB]MDR5656888.1 glycosyltransferase [Halodesulfurarchaeum sp. HSR-GB]